MIDAVAKCGESEPANVQSVRGLVRLVMSRRTTAVLPAIVARIRFALPGMAPVQEATALGTPPGVAVGTGVALAVGEGGGAVVGAAVRAIDGVAAGEWMAAETPPIPGALQAPTRNSVSIPATNLTDLGSGTADKGTGN